MDLLPTVLEESLEENLESLEVRPNQVLPSLKPASFFLLFFLLGFLCLRLCPWAWRFRIQLVRISSLLLPLQISRPEPTPSGLAANAFTHCSHLSCVLFFGF